MPRTSHRRVLVAAAVVGCLVALVPAGTASAQACSVDQSCSNGKTPKKPEPNDSPATKVKVGWVTYVDADGAGSYSRVMTYVEPRKGICFDTNGVGVGCP